MLTTLLPPTAGTARVAGHDIVREGPAVRAAIGAALQEAALDPLLTGREHMRLQTTLQGVPKAERRPRGDELIERVGLADAADRKVGGYSGGMKRRLDLALALVHRPRILFLDEPTTGLDPSSRADMWEEVARLAREEGVTVFLTTQYLEEADVLADRVGIIDHGQIVAEGTPEALKAEIGRPSLEVTPADRDDRAHGRVRARALRQRRARRRPRRRPCACAAARRSSRPWCARSTPRTSRCATSSCTPRRSTTCSWPRPAASSTPATRRARASTPRRCRHEHARARSARWRGARSCRRCASPRW